MKQLRPLMSEQILLPVADADRIITALQDARVVRRLGGLERQLLTEALKEISKAREGAASMVELKHECCVKLLKCIGATQTWWNNMLDEFGHACAVDD